MKKSQLYLEEMALFLLLSQEKGRQELVRLLKEHLQRAERLCTSVLAIQEFIRLWQNSEIQGSPRKLGHCIRDFEDIFETILPVQHRDIRRALSLQEEYLLKPSQALHLSLIYGHGIEAMLGPAKPYSAVPIAKFIPLPLL